MKNYEFTDFEYGDLNRAISQKNVKSKKKSIQEVGLLGPVTVTRRSVTGKLFVIDGQHRIRACEELQEESNFLGEKNDYYIKEDMVKIIPYTDEETLIKIMSVMNSVTVRWKQFDYIATYAKIKPIYANIMSFMKTYPDFQAASYVDLLSVGAPKGSKCSLLYLKQGTFQIGNYNTAIDIAEKLMEISEYTDAYKHFQFVRAFIKILNHRDYKHSHFISQLKSKKNLTKDSKDLFYGLAYVEVFYNNIQTVYNKDVRVKTGNRLD